MRNAIITLILVLTTASIAHGFQISEWINFSSNKGQFSVSLPAEPEEEIQNTQIQPFDFKTGKTLDKKVAATSYLVRSLTAEGIFMVVWVDYESTFTFDTAGELIANRDSFLRESGARLLTEKKIEFNGSPALEFTAEKSPGILITARIYIIDKRPFVLVAAMKNQAEQNHNANKFLSSFKITAKE